MPQRLNIKTNFSKHSKNLMKLHFNIQGMNMLMKANDNFWNFMIFNRFSENDTHTLPDWHTFSTKYTRNEKFSFHSFIQNTFLLQSNEVGSLRGMNHCVYIHFFFQLQNHDSFSSILPSLIFNGLDDSSFPSFLWYHFVWKENFFKNVMLYIIPNASKKITQKFKF